MQQRNPWMWGQPFDQMGTPSPEPEPEPEPEPPVAVWNGFTTHAQIDGWVGEQSIDLPDDWTTRTLAGKREFLDMNAATEPASE